MNGSTQQQTTERLAPHADLRTDAWYAVWLRSHYEHVVTRQLTAKGFNTFLPELRTWSRRPGAPRMISLPMFPGYVFVRDALDKHRYIDLMKVPGVVRVLEDGWTRLTPVPDADIAAIDRIVSADLPAFPCAHLKQGDRVRVLAGPLTGVEGLFVQDKATKGRLIVSVDMLGRSIAVEMDGFDVEPCSPSPMRVTHHALDHNGLHHG